MLPLNGETTFADAASWRDVANLRRNDAFPGVSSTVTTRLFRALRLRRSSAAH